MPRSFVGLSIVLAVAAACAADNGFGPSGAFEHAVLNPACGPADGPAMTLYLAAHAVNPRSPAVPYIRISVWAGRETVGGRTWRLGGSGDTASAVLVRGPDNYENARGGHVAIGVIDTTATTQGSALLMFPTLGLVSGDFRAAWSPDAPMCG
jgi:hypothetical protein